MSEIRTTVDEKIISNISGPQENLAEPVEEAKVDAEIPVKDDESSDLATQSNEVKEVKDTHESQPSTNHDDFGNEVAPPKVYTEEEVNRMMRERFRRSEEGKRVEAQKYTQNIDQNPTQEGDENWEQQLEGFVERTVQKLSQKEVEKARVEKEKEIMSEFEDKMIKGMGRYKDFADVVKGTTITNDMLLATRSMKDPAAFIYAASKTQGKELERIAKIPDAYTQALEMGRLEERMRRVRSGTSSPKPVSEIKGDVANTQNFRQNVDDLIIKDALKRHQNRRF